MCPAIGGTRYLDGRLHQSLSCCRTAAERLLMHATASSTELVPKGFVELSRDHRQDH